MQHLEEGTIHAWLDGALSADEQAGVEQHVQQCAECAALVAEARGMIAGAARIVGALDVVPGGVIPKQRGSAAGSASAWRSLRLTPFRAALAASLMIAAASLAVFRQGGSDAAIGRMQSERAMSVSAPASAPAPTAPIAASMDSVASAQGSGAKAARDQAADRSTAGIPRERRASSEKQQLAEGPVAPTPAPKLEAARAAQLSARAPASVANAAPPATRPPSAVVGGIAADAAQPAPRDSLASSRQRLISLESVVGQALSATQFLMTTSNETGSFVGCYDVPSDSNASRGTLPERFALERLPGNPPRNVVFPIDPAGRLGTTEAGTWREIDRSSFMLTLTSGGQRDSVRADGAFAKRAEMRASYAASRSLRVVRTSCPR